MHGQPLTSRFPTYAYSYTRLNSALSLLICPESSVSLVPKAATVSVLCVAAGVGGAGQQWWVRSDSPQLCHAPCEVGTCAGELDEVDEGEEDCGAQVSHLKRQLPCEAQHPSDGNGLAVFICMGVEQRLNLCGVHSAPEQRESKCWRHKQAASGGLTRPWSQGSCHQ